MFVVQKCRVIYKYSVNSSRMTPPNTFTEIHQIHSVETGRKHSTQKPKFKKLNFSVTCRTNMGDVIHNYAVEHADFDMVTVEQVDRCLGMMKLGKAAWYDGIEVEHIMYMLTLYLLLFCVICSILCSCMVWYRRCLEWG